ncbi:hypothetical protein [Zhouia amylolytica]|uniref:hypothetical protein n=1 Tax=Zhouia amylolytica TaxID=376730 RepID=UPI0020CFBA88|nr:hypothetical protein [Zhouia amylolytica]MCQ0111420.1 hypothetical protein [Zhouia amylolytica]
MNKLITTLGSSEIRESEILIQNYPFEPSVAYPGRTFIASEIEGVVLDFGNPKLHVTGDIVFVAAKYKNELKAFAKKNQISILPYSWNWDWVLEPFLDTEFSKADQRKTIEQLLKNGLRENEIMELRQEVGNQMIAYNFNTLLWEWVGLSLFDVLSAMKAKYAKAKYRDFYQRALEIEKRSTNHPGRT